MALIKCPECGQKISNKITSCPNCGYQLREPNMRMHTPPVGTPKNKRGNGCLIGIFVFLALAALVGSMSAKRNSQTTHETTSAAEFTKDDAMEIDNTIWENVEIAIKANNDIVGNLEKALTGEISQVEYYDYCKEISKVLGNNSLSFPKSDNEGAKSYINSSTQYVLQVQILSKSVIKYIDKSNTKNLSDVKSNIEQCTELATIVAQNRGVFLKTNGFTDEEIQELIEQISVE